MAGYMAAEALLKTLLLTNTYLKASYAASTISFDESDSKILDSGNGLGFFTVGDSVTVSGSTLNDGTYGVVAVAAGYLVISGTLADEAASAAVTVSRPSPVTQGDYRILDSGLTFACVLVPGAVPGYDTASMTRVQVWESMMDLFIRNVDETTYADFGTFRDSVIATIDAAPCLSESYFITMIRSDGPPADYGQTLAGQTLIVTIQEQV